MQFSDEELIDYLLGDAAEGVAERIEQQLPTDLELLARLGEFRVVLEQIDSLGGGFEPPADLVDVTLARIDTLADSPLDTPADSSDLAGDPVDSSETDHAAQPLEAIFSATRDSAEGNSGGYRPLQLNSLGDAVPRRSSFWDSTVLTISLTVLCCLALPALVRVRFESRKAQCARNLSVTGTELIQYALNHPGQRFPYVALEGPEAFAGVFALRLREAGVKLTPSQLQCASLIGMCEEVGPPTSSAGTFPSLSELHQLAARELSQWQQSIGGDYAYNLGVVEQDKVVAPKCQGSSYFAILADSPVIMPTGGAGQGGAAEEFIAHEGKGINVFYEDGRVVFMTTASLHQPLSNPHHLADNPLRNQRGAHEVGLHSQDASLAPSHFPPLGRPSTR